jgi:CheY-like chemotaxis protein
MLEIFGCRVATACNGSEALAAIESSSYDVILMDCQMPIMDGYEATRRLRAMERQRSEASAAVNQQKRLVIIAMTAHTLPGQRHICLDAGMNDYLSKPFSISDLEEVLSRWHPDSWQQNNSSDDTRTPTMETHLDNTIEQSSRAVVSASATIDISYLNAIRSLQRPGRPDLLKTVVKQFSEDGVRQIETMRNGFAAKDAASVQAASHRLKSGSANLGAGWLAELCNELESICKNGLLPDDTALLAEIEEGYQKARIQLEAIH